MLHLLIGLLILTALVVLTMRLVVNPLSRPAAIGLAEHNSLQPCPGTPNCVSSQAATDAAEYIQPLQVSATQEAPIDAVSRHLGAVGNYRIVTQDPHYLHAEFITPLMAYRDDLELLADPAQPGQVQVRSASRVGRSDLGKNRARVEALRQALASDSSATTAD
ncbi:DUF1499 domain-containing protein [Natronospirillum operosum]|nr:DUF1499 domain-containing protein [Natronospirillum operosum]